MRKSIIPKESGEEAFPGQRWLDLGQLAQVELTSEDPAYPVEGALQSGSDRGWQAGEPGKQTVRLLFDKPLRVRRVRLVFCESGQSRTQEFVLRWSDGEGGYREIVRQQYNFSAPGSACEREDYTVDLPGLKALELEITPDISGGNARASMAQLRLG